MSGNTDHDRRQAEYQAALEALRAHLRECAECRKVWEVER